MPSGLHCHTHVHVLVCAPGNTQPIDFAFCFWFLCGCCEGDGGRRQRLGLSKIKNKQINKRSGGWWWVGGGVSGCPKGADVFFEPILCERVSLWRRLKALPLVIRIMEARQEEVVLGVGGLAFVFVRSKAVQKGGERAILLTCRGGGKCTCFHSAGQFIHHAPLSATSVPDSMHMMCKLTQTDMVDTHSLYKQCCTISYFVCFCGAASDFTKCAIP